MRGLVVFLQACKVAEMMSRDRAVRTITLIVVSAMYGMAYAMIYWVAQWIDPTFKYTIDPLSGWIGSVTVLISYRNRIFK